MVKFNQVVYDIVIQEPSSEISGREDLMGRIAYEQLIYANPKTGEIPLGIRSAELAFSNRLAQSTRSLRTTQLNIQSSGPFNVGGRTRAVAFDIRDENTILAGGVSGGMWKSTDGGQTWTRKSDPLNRNSVTCIVQDTRPEREDIWYHGTGEIVGNSASGGGSPFRGDGIYKSVDNGETWNPIPSTQDADPNFFNSQFQYIWGIEVNEGNLMEDELLVAAYGGILRSLDAGNSWDVVLGDSLFNLNDSVDLNESNASFYTSISQSSNGVFYATLSTESSTDDVSDDAGIYLSRDGVVWDPITPFTEESQYRRIVIGHSESNPNITYFLVDSSPIFILHHSLGRFDDRGTFQLRETPNFGGDLGDFDTQGSYNMMIRVHPENPDIVFAGGTNLYRSTDGFSSSENSKWIGGYDPEGSTDVYLNHHPDQHDLLFYPSNADRMLSASDGGLRLSEDGTADSVMWQSLNNGFLTSQFFTIAQSKEEGDPTLIGGMQDNGTDLTLSSGLSNWREIIGGDGGYAATTLGNQLWFASFQNGQTLRLTLNSDLAITSFGRVDPGNLVAESGSAYLFINPFVLDPLNPNRMFIAGGNHLYFNANVSQIPSGSQEPTSLGWERVTQNSDSISIVSAVDISFDSEVVYFGTSSGQLFKLSNASNSANFIVDQLDDSSFPESAYISCIAIHPEDQDHILVIFSNYNIPSIFESTDGGQTFSDISGNLEENTDGTGNGPSIRWAEIIPTNSGILYVVGTSIGLSSTTASNDSSTIWIKESEDLIGNSVIPMMDYRPIDGSLVIATHGNGVFTTNIQDFKRIDVIEDSELNFAIAFASPNPFNDETKIQYTIPESGTVKIDLYTLGGELINNLLWAPQFPGTNEITWNGTNASGVELTNGVYFYRIQYEDQALTGKLIFRR